MSLLAVEGVSKRFGSVAALDDVSLAIEAGGRTAVVGPSGSGKSTLLRIIAGFEAPDAGSVHFEGAVVADGRRLVPAHRRPIGLVSQDGALFPHLDVAANIGFGIDARGFERNRHVAALMDMVELDRSMLSRRPHELSGGQQQRVALARALARHPKLMLLDEPFSALDTGLRDALRRTVTDLLAAEGIAAVLVTHDQAEALSFADQVAVLRNGRLAQVGPPETLYREPADAATAAFLGDAVLLPATLEGRWAVCALGRLEVDQGDGDGPVEVMIRPEQIRVAAVPDGALAAGIAGRVLRTEFKGGTCMVHVRLAGSQGRPLLSADGSGANVVRVPVPSLSVPSVNDLVELRVEGRARVFDPRPPLGSAPLPAPPVLDR